jgi:hypothetical protein
METVFLKSIEIFNAYRHWILTGLLLYPVIVIGKWGFDAFKSMQEEIDE